MHTCKVTIGSLFGLSLLMLTSSCDGGAASGEVPGPRLRAFT